MTLLCVLIGGSVATTGAGAEGTGETASWLILSVPEGATPARAAIGVPFEKRDEPGDIPWVRSIKGKARSGFEQLAILEFSDGKAFEAWRAAHAAQLESPVLGTRARVLASSGDRAARSPKSMLKISYYSLTVPVSEFLDWVDGYLVKYLRAQRSAGILASYAMFLEEGEKGRALLVLEYPDASTEKSAEPIKEKLSDELAAHDAVYAEQMRRKEQVRVTDTWTLAVPALIARN